MKQLSVTVSLRNNRLVERRKALGFSQPQMAKAIGVDYQWYVSMECLRSSPIGYTRCLTTCAAPECDKKPAFPPMRGVCEEHAKANDNQVTNWRNDKKAKLGGHWIGAAKKIAAYFEVEPEELWPEEVLALKKVSETKTFDVSELKGLLAAAPPSPLLPDEIIIQKETTSALTRAIAKLSSREKQIIERRFGLENEPETLSEIGATLSHPINRERVRQIETKALKKLKVELKRK